MTISMASPAAKRHKSLTVTLDEANKQDRTKNPGSAKSNQQLEAPAFVKQEEFLVREKARLKRDVCLARERVQQSSKPCKHNTLVLRELKHQALDVGKQLASLRGGIAIPSPSNGLRPNDSTRNLTHPSSGTPFPDLPPVVSHLIFEFVVGPWAAVRSDREAQRYLAALFRLTHVSRQWRRLIRGNSSLWRVSALPFLRFSRQITFPIAHDILNLKQDQLLNTFVSVDDACFSPFKSPNYTSRPHGYATPSDVTFDFIAQSFIYSTKIFIRGCLDFSGKLYNFIYCPLFTVRLPLLRDLVLEDIHIRTDLGCLLSYVPNLETLTAHKCHGLFDTDVIKDNKEFIVLDRLQRISVLSADQPYLPGLLDLFRFVRLPKLTKIVFHNEIQPSIHEILSNALYIYIENLHVQLGSEWSTPIQRVVESLRDLPIPELIIEGVVAPRKRNSSGRQRLVSIGTLVEVIGQGFSVKGPRTIVFKRCALAPSRLRDAVKAAQERVGRSVAAVVFDNCYLVDGQEWANVALYNWAQQQVQDAGLGWTWTQTGMPYYKRTAVAYRIGQGDTPNNEDRYFRPGRGPCKEKGQWDETADVELRAEDNIEVPRCCYIPLD